MLLLKLFDYKTHNKYKKSQNFGQLRIRRRTNWIKWTEKHSLPGLSFGLSFATKIRNISVLVRVQDRGKCCPQREFFNVSTYKIFIRQTSIWTQIMQHSKQNWVQCGYYAWQNTNICLTQVLYYRQSAFNEKDLCRKGKICSTMHAIYHIWAFLCGIQYICTVQRNLIAHNGGYAIKYNVQVELLVFLSAWNNSSNCQTSEKI